MINASFCFKKNGEVYKTLPKKLNVEQRYILRHVQYFLGINPHMPYGVEMQLAEYLGEDMFGGEKTRELGQKLSDIAFEVALTQKDTINNKRIEI